MKKINLFLFITFFSIFLLGQFEECNFCKPPKIISNPPEEGVVNELYQYEVRATGTPPIEWLLEENPPGMKIDSDGLITWVPAKGGTFIFFVIAKNECGEYKQTVTVNVCMPPDIITSPVTQAEVDVLYKYQPDLKNNANASWSLIEGPQGLTIDTTTGLIKWTPTSSNVGTHKVSIKAKNKCGEDSQSWEITVAEKKSLKIIALNPDKGYVTGGNEVKIFGRGFQNESDLKVSFGGILAKNVIILSDTEGIVIAPAWTGNIGPVDVKAFFPSGANDTLKDGYLYYYCPAISFKSQSVTLQNAVTSTIASADFNKDGFIDLVVGDVSKDGIWILMGKGDGSFETPSFILLADYPYSIKTYDLNKDSNIDIVVANEGADNVSVILGKGDGSFFTPVQYPVGDYPTSLAIADFNGDKFPDIAVSLFVENAVKVLINNGDGTFTLGKSSPTGKGPRSLIALDLDKEGTIDLGVALSISEKLSILINNGAGEFSELESYLAGDYPYFIGSADFYEDVEKIQDILVLNAGVFPGRWGSLSLYKGNGNGTFQSPTEISLYQDPRSFTISDLNGDRISDIAVTHYRSGTIILLFGNGNGTFTTRGLNLSITQLFITSADLDNDNDIDYIVSFASNYISVLINNGNAEGACNNL